MLYDREYKCAFYVAPVYITGHSKVSNLGHSLWARACKETVSSSNISKREDMNNKTKRNKANER